MKYLKWPHFYRNCATQTTQSADWSSLRLSIQLPVQQRWNSLHSRMKVFFCCYYCTNILLLMCVFFKPLKIISTNIYIYVYRVLNNKWILKKNRAKITNRYPRHGRSSTYECSKRGFYGPGVCTKNSSCTEELCWGNFGWNNDEKEILTYSQK